MRFSQLAAMVSVGYAIDAARNGGGWYTVHTANGVTYGPCPLPVALGHLRDCGGVIVDGSGRVVRDDT